MSIPKRFYFTTSKGMDDFVKENTHVNCKRGYLVLTRVRSAYTRLSYHPGRAVGGRFSLTICYDTGKLHVEYKHVDGKMRSRVVRDVLWRPARPFELILALVRLDLGGYSRMVHNGTLDYDGRIPKQSKTSALPQWCAN